MEAHERALGRGLKHMLDKSRASYRGEYLLGGSSACEFKNPEASVGGVDRRFEPRMSECSV